MEHNPPKSLDEMAERLAVLNVRISRWKQKIAEAHVDGGEKMMKAPCRFAMLQLNQVSKLLQEIGFGEWIEDLRPVNADGRYRIVGSKEKAWASSGFPIEEIGTAYFRHLAQWLANSETVIADATAGLLDYSNEERPVGPTGHGM